LLGYCHGHGTIADPQLRVNLLQMVLDSVVGEAESAGDNFVGKPIPEAAEHFAFTWLEDPCDVWGWVTFGLEPA
jgi:hypothetical protein